MNELATTELIEVKQLPIITQQLQRISQQAQADVDFVLSMQVTEDTVKTAKQERARLNKLFKDLEDRRKAVKSAILKPYDEFEEIYKEYITNVFSPADKTLKDRIDDVESELRLEKQKELEEHFAGLAQEKELDFLAFGDLGIKVLLSSSVNKLKDEITETVERIADEIGLIQNQEHAEEIIVEYKKHFSLTEAMRTVADRKARIGEERRRQEELQKVREEAERLRQEQAEPAKPIEVVLHITPEPKHTPVAECYLCTTQFFKGDTAYQDPHVPEYFYCEACISTWKVKL